MWHGAREVLRSLSYYEMKNRAGVVGRNGLGPLLGGLAAPVGHTMRVHLMGHSFGALAGYRSRVDGPLVATFTSADRAVGWWYPMASMLSHQDAESVGDLGYRWGGLGHDAYQQAATSTAVLAKPRTGYGFATGAFYRLDSNAVIKADQSPVSGAHSDIQHPEVAWAAISAAGLG